MKNDTFSGKINLKNEQERVDENAEVRQVSVGNKIERLTEEDLESIAGGFNGKFDSAPK
ncbi:hypothetical protein [Chromobacterium violaceum]|uniref:hypothetical protein n=1 Tax=Chromobacterium violaceum TaxID=536 RepID=UPI0012D320AC|nr:hypothetical protein [Chromobacterium violaceum]